MAKTKIPLPAMPKTPLGLGIMVGVAVLIYLAVTKKKGQTIAGAAGSAAVEAAGEFGVGVVVGIGETVGVPPTNVDKCAESIKNGTLWDVSLHCPASDYVAEAWKRTPSLFGSSTVN